MEIPSREITNPYHPGQIPEKKSGFFGRDELVVWIEQNIISSRRLLLLHGASLIGKTTFVHFLPKLITLNIAPIITFTFSDLTDFSISNILFYIIQEMVRQLKEHGILRHENIAMGADAFAVLDRLFNHVKKHENGGNVLLIIDDFDYFPESNDDDLFQLLDAWHAILNKNNKVYILLTVSNSEFLALRHPLIDSAPTHSIGSLSANQAIQMITNPLEGIIRFDYGVPKRIAQLNSNHPHYITLFNHTLFTHFAREGWVNMRHLDEVMDDLLSTDIPSFEDHWQQSTKIEQTVLVAIASVRGTHGLFTRQEIVKQITKRDKRADESVIVHALTELIRRDVLVKMGALGYKFYVDIFRYWLGNQMDLDEFIREVDWKSITVPEITTVRFAPSHHEEQNSRPTLNWKRWAYSFLAVVVVLVGGAYLADMLGVFNIDGSNNNGTSAIGIVTYEAGENGNSASMAGTPTVTLTPEPTKTPTPTLPIVVARSLPAIAYMARQGDSAWRIEVMDADGTNNLILSNVDTDEISPVWSPVDGKLAFVSRRDGNKEIYVMNIQGKENFNVTNHPADEWTPAWSPDGKRLAFSSNREGNWEIYTINADGTGLQQITDNGEGNISPDWSPDGQYLTFSNRRSGNWNVCTIRIDGSELRQLTTSDGNDLSPIWSPSGRMITYETNDTGDVEIFVMTSLGGNPYNVTNMTRSDEHGPVWTPDGEQLLFYSNRDDNWDLYSMSLDGTNLTNLTQTPNVHEQTPVWRP